MRPVLIGHGLIVRGKVERRVGGAEHEYISLSKAEVLTRSSVVTKRMGDRYVLGLAPALRFCPESNSVQTPQKSFG